MSSNTSSTLHALLPKNKADLFSSIPEADVGMSIHHMFKQSVDAYYDGSFDHSWKLSDILLDILWEKLNMGNWKDVSLAWRKAYGLASVLKVMTHFSRQSQPNRSDKDMIHEGIKICDMGLLMGSPVLDNILQKVIDALQRELQEIDTLQRELQEDTLHCELQGIDCDVEKKRCLKRKNADVTYSAKVPLIRESNIERISCPALETFRTEFLNRSKPVILMDCMSHWPAMTLWCVEYIKQKAGPRTVPIELGSRYTDHDWSQKLMTVSDFIDRYVINSDGVGYLAQHQLFDQIPDLERDIKVPDYCCLGDEVDINAWFGPKGTISPLHYDPKQNFLAQVMGEKYIRLYDESMTSFLYPHSDKLLFNTSQVDVENPDPIKFADFQKAEFVECILRPGEMLYIPPRCWHYVRSLTVSFSVSFWWKYHDGVCL